MILSSGVTYLCDLMQKSSMQFLTYFSKAPNGFVFLWLQTFPFASVIQINFKTRVNPFEAHTRAPKYICQSPNLPTLIHVNGVKSWFSARRKSFTLFVPKKKKQSRNRVDKSLYTITSYQISGWRAKGNSLVVSGFVVSSVKFLPSLWAV